MVRLLLVRHAESTGNAGRLIQGVTDLSLTPFGERQAEALAQRLAHGYRPHALYASPLRRAWETALAIGTVCGLSPRLLPEARERDFGVGNGMPIAQAVEQYAVPAGGAGDLRLSFPGEEAYDAFCGRVAAAFLALEERHGDETIVVVTHSGSIAAFLSVVLGLPAGRQRLFRIGNASITTLDLHGGVATVLGINDRCHLDTLARPD